MKKPALVPFIGMIFLALFLAGRMGEGAETSSSPPDAVLLKEKARQKNLANHPTWRRLLHYRPSLLGFPRSDIDGPNFFLSKRGRRDPQAELDATLDAFFSPPPPAGSDMEPPRCQFPERYHWLDGELGFPKDLPRPACPRFESWKEKIDPESVSMMFASYYLNNPASMYGHTFLRLGRKGYAEDKSLLDYTVNYAAVTTTNNGILFALLGLTGGFRGTYSTTPYYMKIQQYNNLESRDLWEYQLSMNQEEVDRLLRHLWELGHTSIAYYFLNKNCSYQLLPLLEVADPSLSVSNRFHFRAIPLDTMKAVIGQPGLLKKTTYRPAHLHQMMAKKALLTKPETRLATDLVFKKTDPPKAALSGTVAKGVIPAKAGIQVVDLPSEGMDSRLRHSGMTPPLQLRLSALSPVRQALVLDAAYDLLKYRYGFRRGQLPFVKAREQDLLLLRNAVNVPAAEAIKVTVKEPPPPEAAHKTGRLGTGAGVTRDSSFEELSFRGSLHDLEEDPKSYVAGSQLEMFKLVLRYDNDRGKGTVEEATLIDVKSLRPWETWVHQPSWGIRIGAQTAHDLNWDPEDSLNFGVGGASGLSFSLPGSESNLIYTMAEVDSGVNGQFEDNIRAGGGGSVGLLIRPIERWRLHLRGSFIRYGIGQVSSATRLKLVQDFSIDRDVGLRLILERQNYYREGLLAIHWYY